MTVAPDETSVGWTGSARSAAPLHEHEVGGDHVG